MGARDFTLTDTIERNAQLYGERLALVFGEEQVTHADHRAGVAPRDSTQLVCRLATASRSFAQWQTLEAADVINFCQTNMAYYMVPRFVEFAAQLPKTMTPKVEKYKLRAAAESRLSKIWDREKAGIKITR